MRSAKSWILKSFMQKHISFFTLYFLKKLFLSLWHWIKYFLRALQLIRTSLRTLLNRSHRKYIGISFIPSWFLLWKFLPNWSYLIFLIGLLINFINNSEIDLRWRNVHAFFISCCFIFRSYTTLSFVHLSCFYSLD